MSCEVRHDVRREEFVSLDVVPVVAVDQQVHTGVLILADQIDGAAHAARFALAVYYAKYRGGMTVGEAVKAGVPRGYVAWDVARGFITLKPEG